MARRVAAIDCGTNSIRLLVMEDAHPPRELDRRLELVRLGQGVDQTGKFHPDALARTFAACESYARIIGGFGCDAVRFVATSAARDVANREQFFAGVRERLGVEADIVSGDEEARLSFSGALSGVEASGRVLVIDIGGGSTELVLGEASGEVLSAVSLDVGSVRVTERFFTDRPPTATQVADARDFAGQLLDDSGIDFSSVTTAIGVAGTVTSMSAALQRLPAYDRARVHGSVLAVKDIEAITTDWLAATLDDMVSRPCMHPLRAEVLPAGSLILSELVRRLDIGAVLVSETDILDGIAYRLLGGQGR